MAGSELGIDRCEMARTKLWICGWTANTVKGGQTLCGPSLGTCKKSPLASDVYYVRRREARIGG